MKKSRPCRRRGRLSRCARSLFRASTKNVTSYCCSEQTRADRAASVRDADGHPRIRLDVTLPRDALERELIIAGAQRRRVERDVEMAVRVLGEIVDDRHTTLVDAVDGHAI